MSELKVIDVDRMADVMSLSGQFYRKSEADEVISTIRAERDEYRYNLSCARNEIHNMQIAMKDDIKSITNKDKEIQRLEKLCENYRCDCDNLAIMTDILKKNGRSLRQNMNHQKYKRCLAMARWCLTESVYFHYRYDDWGDKGYDRPYKWKKVVFWKKWARYWLELSEKFKEAK